MSMGDSEGRNQLSVAVIDEAEWGRLWQPHHHFWQQAGPFVAVPWLRAWWDNFGEPYTQLLLGVYSESSLISLAPLMVRGENAHAMGSADICDHVDFPTVTDRLEEAAKALLIYLRERGLHRLIIHAARPDSMIVRHLAPAARALHCRVAVEPTEVAASMHLPAQWQDYLDGLSGKQRHEVRRKFRRLDEAGTISRKLVQDPADVTAVLDIFFAQFRASRTDKLGFMNPVRERFFRGLAHNLAVARMLILQLVEIDGVPAATTFCMDDGDTIYLYNNGYNLQFKHLSIGTLSKLMMVGHAIETGKTVFDFLNGAEPYKFRLGGREVELSRVTIAW
jgi:CelD/BcsL family acetyltransferase involved in cellulose biosynthesis